MNKREQISADFGAIRNKREGGGICPPLPPTQNRVKKVTIWWWWEGTEANVGQWH